MHLSVALQHPPTIPPRCPICSGELAGKEEALAALQAEKEELEGKHNELRWVLWLAGSTMAAQEPHTHVVLACSEASSAYLRRTTRCDPPCRLLPSACSDAHGLLTHQKGEVDAELATVRETLATAQDALAAAEVGGGDCWWLWSRRPAESPLQPVAVVCALYVTGALLALFVACRLACPRLRSCRSS